MNNKERKEINYLINSLLYAINNYKYVPDFQTNNYYIVEKLKELNQE